MVNVATVESDPVCFGSPCRMSSELPAFLLEQDERFSAACSRERSSFLGKVKDA